MTGMWQVSGRSDLAFDEMVMMDIYYIENWSLLLDLKILSGRLRPCSAAVARIDSRVCKLITGPDSPAGGGKSWLLLPVRS